MSTRVFVGGLTYRVRERDLEKFFRKYGRIRGGRYEEWICLCGKSNVVQLFFLQYGRDKGLCRWASIRHQGKRPWEIFQRLRSIPWCPHQEWLRLCCKYLYRILHAKPNTSLYSIWSEKSLSNHSLLDDSENIWKKTIHRHRKRRLFYLKMYEKKKNLRKRYKNCQFTVRYRGPKRVECKVFHFENNSNSWVDLTYLEPWTHWYCGCLVEMCAGFHRLIYKMFVSYA